VNLPDQPEAQREVAAQPFEAVIHRGHVARHLLYVVERDARRRVVLEKQQVRERGLRPLDLRREDGLLADVDVQKEIGIGQQLRQAIQAAKCTVRPLESVDVLGAEREGWLGR